jgi:hypothetical protein
MADIPSTLQITSPIANAGPTFGGLPQTVQVPPTVSNEGSSGVNSSFTGNKYFTAEDKNFNFLNINNSAYTVLKPQGGKAVVDVWRDMYWSNLGDKSEVPQIFVTEKELQYGSWATQLSNLLTEGGNFLSQIANASNGKNMDVFLQLYNAKNTGFFYNFPWLLKNGDNLRSITSSWDNAQGMASLFGGSGSNTKSTTTGDIIGAGVGAVAGALTPGFGFEDTKQYASTSQQVLSITFPLYNTLDLESAFRHFSFVNLFTFQNLKTRTSLMTYIPPKIYEVDSYAVGGIYMAAAYVSDFKVDSIGTTRAMSDWYAYGPSNILMPEAYKVTIQFTDLLSQSSNVFAGTMGGVKVQITDAAEVTQAAKDTATQAFQATARVADKGVKAGANFVGL